MLIVASLLLTACSTDRDSAPQPGSASSRYGNAQGFDRIYKSTDGRVGFRWVRNPGLVSVETQVLEMVRTSDGAVLFRDDTHFRGRDVNVAGWSTTPNALVAYSGDVGTFVIRPADGDVWREEAGFDPSICLSKEGLRAAGEAATGRLPTCP
jgi:hypothetical protein